MEVENKNQNAGSTTISSDVLKTLEGVDRQLGNDADRGPIETEPVSSIPAEAIDVTPKPFLVEVLGGLVHQGVALSKALGWSGPGIPGIPEEEWEKSVSTYSAVVIQKRWPSLADSATPETALICLLLPWAFWAVPKLIPMLLGRMRTRGKSDSDTRGDGDRKNNTDAKTDRPAEDPNLPN